MVTPRTGKTGWASGHFYVRVRQDVIWLLTLYPKNIAENIPQHVLRQIRKEVDDEKGEDS